MCTAIFQRVLIISCWWFLGVSLFFVPYSGYICSMSKSKTEASEPKNSKPARKSFKLSDYIRKRKKMVAPMIAFLAFAAITAILVTHGFHVISSFTGSTAILYLFAFDGKVSGRMDGNVLMRNGRGRGFVVPALVQNAFTTVVRALLAALSQNWSGGLTDANRASWNSMSWLFKSNRFGQSKQVKGKAAYVALNANLVNAGEATIDDAPLEAGVTTMADDIALAADQSSGIELTTAGAFIAVTGKVLVFATAPQPAGVSRPSESRYRMLDTILGNGTTSPHDITNKYQDKFGTAWSTTPFLGGKIFVKLKPINITSGAEGGNQVFEATIVA